MATIKFYLRSKIDNSNIYIRFTNGRKCDLRKKTGYIINYNDWDSKKNIPKKSTPELKNLKIKLDKLSSFIESNFNESLSRGEEIDVDWLIAQIDLFNNKKNNSNLNIFSNYIQKYIDDAPVKINQQKSLGLSHGRVMNLKLFKKTILRFQKEVLGGAELLIYKIDLHIVEQFKLWLKNQNYSVNYIGKNLDNLKTICIDASKNGFEVLNSIKHLKRISEDKKPEDIIILTNDEQQLIKDAEIKSNHLINARKWLLLGCLLGQRCGDLLSINKKNFKVYKGMNVIELKQEKTGKLVTIPLLPEALDILSDGFPRKISLTRFNEYIKEVCKLSGINEIITGKIKVKSRGPMKVVTLEKFNFISSHTCRRSFASNFYGDIPTPVLINITGHGSEKVFLKYIGKTSYDYAIQMLDYFSKIEKKK